jgi:hypothetical protein
MLNPESRIKLLFDFYKHLTTLNLACLMLMVGLFDKVFHNYDNNVKSIFAAFTFSLFFSFMGMVTLIIDPNFSKAHIIRKIAFVLPAIASVIGFFIGIHLTQYYIFNQFPNP